MSSLRKEAAPTQFRVPNTTILIDEMQEGLALGKRIAELMDPQGENLNGKDAYDKARSEYEENFVKSIPSQLRDG